MCDSSAAWLTVPGGITKQVDFLLGEAGFSVDEVGRDWRETEHQWVEGGGTVSKQHAPELCIMLVGFDS
jgi:hypothetical protein